MKYSKRYNIILKIFLFVFIFYQFIPTTKVYADELRFYNHNTKSNVNYSGNQASFFYNNKKIDMTYPGIILSGSALADYEELFVQGIGLSAELNDNKIVISDGSSELILTVGSKTAKFNGQNQSISVAPVKLEFENNSIKYYVPTRFVAESFGYNYVWDSANNEARITKTFRLVIDGKTTLYNDTLFSASYLNKEIDFSLPVILHKNIVYAPAKQLFDTLGCVYASNEDSISVTKDNITLQIQYNNSFVTINGISFDMDAAPISVTEYITNENAIYIPLEFCAKMLGFEVLYTENKALFDIIPTEYTGIPELHPELKQYFQVKLVRVEPTPLTTYFEWTPEKTTKIEGTKNLTKVKAYSIEDADVLELYGIKRDDVYDFMDNRALVLELSSVISNMDTMFYADFNCPHINYVLLTTINNNSKLFIMTPLEDIWEFEETKECLRIYFMSEEVSINDLIIFEEEKITIEKQIPEVIYPDNRLIIPLPEGYDPKSITLQDDYLNCNIKIFLSGDMVKFFEHNTPINPYDFIDDIKIVYDASTKQTIITCHTTGIYGFEEIIHDKFYALYLAKPSEIFDKIIVLDAGHGGKDPGTVQQNIYEKNIVLSIINSTEKLFENCDIKVYCTRTTNKYLTLQQRTEFVKRVTADLFISLHLNSSEYKSVSGTEVYYSNSNNAATKYGLTSQKMARIFVDNLSEAMDSKSRGVLNSNFYVTKYNSVPAVLIELGFLSNSEERLRLTNPTYQQKAAKTIYESVIEIFSAYPTGR